MAGTLTISTLSDGTNSTSATNCIQGSAKAWVNFNGTGTPAIRGSFNVSSITKNGTGFCTVNLTTAMPDANYAVTGGCWNTAGTGFAILTANNNSGIVRTTSAVGVITGDSNSYYDVAYVYVAIFR